MVSCVCVVAPVCVQASAPPTRKGVTGPLSVVRRQPRAVMWKRRERMSRSSSKRQKKNVPTKSNPLARPATTGSDMLCVLCVCVCVCVCMACPETRPPKRGRGYKKIMRTHFMSRAAADWPWPDRCDEATMVTYLGRPLRQGDDGDLSWSTAATMAAYLGRQEVARRWLIGGGGEA